ncbi:MAG TPA: GntR family transcriptional regulator, partial [Telmatospirillum sp.]|nr:GntR family transcriptional regulator [Telmatospirillum sp.]
MRQRDGTGPSPAAWKQTGTQSLAANDIDRRNRRLADQLFDHLRDDIVSGVLPPGTPLAELDLCNRLGVSRTPVREALIKLADIKLVNIYPQRGTFVAPISAEAFRSAQFIREHLECALLSEAVRHIDATSLRELNEIVERQKQAVAINSRDAFYEQDEAFH